MIHAGNCSFCNDGRGVQENILGEANGQWLPSPANGYRSYQDAVIAAQPLAQAMNIHYQNCARCRPNVR